MDMDGERLTNGQGAITDDGLLLVRAGGGERAAFCALVRRRMGEVFRFFRLLGEKEHEAEDCAQETFLRLYEYRRRYRHQDDRSFAVLLYTIARRVHADAWRSRRRRVEPVALDGDAGLVLASGSSASREDWFDAQLALSHLPEKLRSVVVLNMFQGLCYAEVAAALAIPVGTVKSRMSLAVGRMRAFLDVPSRR